MSAIAKLLRLVMWALLLPVLILVKLAIRPFEKPRIISSEKVSEILARRISDTPDWNEWDEFVCSPIADARLESVRRASADISERFPSRESPLFLNPEGVAQVRRWLDELQHT